MIGAINWDVSIFEERFARPGEEVPVRQVEEFSGGKGANVAVACARILGRGRVQFIGALGDDDVARRQLSCLRDEGVLTEGVATVRGVRSGRAFIVVDANGRKTIHTHFGANDEITPEHISGERVARALERTRMLIVMDAPTAVAFAAARIAKGRGSRILYSPGVRAMEGARALERLVQLADFAVFDSHEIGNLYQGGDEKAALGRFADAHPRLTSLVTLGQRGCMIARDGITSTIEGVDLSLLGKRAVNSTGSGDAFLGVFASYLLSGRSALDAAIWANLAGALKATRYETRGSPTRHELESAMARLEKVRHSRLGLPASRVAWPGRRR